MIIGVDVSGRGFNIGDVELGLDAPLFVMAGPCVIESESHCLDVAGRLVDYLGGLLSPLSGLVLAAEGTDE